MKPALAHVIVCSDIDEPPALECVRCGVGETLLLPQPVAMVLRAMSRFCDEHRDCIPPGGE